MDISFEINGKKVGSIRCPEHNKSANIKGKGRSLDKLKFEVSGCCEKLINKVKLKLR